MNDRKNIYFASDFHLGAPNYNESLIREKKIVRWLDEISVDAKEIYLVGDIFDFWFEYKHAIPKGFVRLQGKIAELTDKGVTINVFRGNHDMWIFDYLPKELGINIIEDNVIKLFDGKKFFIGHGDGLGPGDHGYKLIKKIFANKLCQWAFARLHPNFGMEIANYWSKKSRKINVNYDEQFLGEENEWLAIFAKEYLKKDHVDFFIFGHRHLPLEIKLTNHSTYVNLGEWIKYNSYAVFNGSQLTLKYFK